MLPVLMEETIVVSPVPHTILTSIIYSLELKAVLAFVLMANMKILLFISVYPVTPTARLVMEPQVHV